MLKIVVNGRVLSQSKVEQKSLAKFASDLNKKLPKSEEWFLQLYAPFRCSLEFSRDKHNLNARYNERLKDKFNEPFQGFIPDVINHAYRYIIEVDGSIHNLEHIKIKDRAKESLYKYTGYKVFRIKAYDLSSWNNFKKDFTNYSKEAINK